MKISIGNKSIGDGCPCFIIAEAGANWKYCSSMKKNYRHALKLIDIAADAGADAVKFQVYRANRLYVREAGYADYIGKKRPIYDIIKDMELPYDWLPKLKEHCDKKNIIFLASAFDEDSADELEKINIGAHKIASYCITHLPLITHIAKKGKPVLMSTGASDIRDIKEAVDTIRSAGNKKIVLFQCTAKYPAPLESVNLRVIPSLIRKFNLPVGLSDHSREPVIASLGAVALGAKSIEKHYTTDNSLDGPDHGFAILPEELKNLVDSIRKLEACLGTEKKEVTSFEKELYKFARRSVHATRDISRGERLAKDNIAVLRNGKMPHGLHPMHIGKLLGKKAKVSIKSGEGITWEMAG